MASRLDWSNDTSLPSLFNIPLCLEGPRCAHCPSFLLSDLFSPRPPPPLPVPLDAATRNLCFFAVLRPNLLVLSLLPAACHPIPFPLRGAICATCTLRFQRPSPFPQPCGPISRFPGASLVPKDWRNVVSDLRPPEPYPLFCWLGFFLCPRP